VFELVFLGTSASAPSVQRGLSSALVMANEHRFMIDCGEGTQRQLLRTGLGFRRLDKILLTHGHLDHILGLGGLASTLGRWEALEELNIYGGAMTLARVHMLMEVVFGPGQIPNSGVTLNLIAPGVIFDDKHFTLTAVPVQHRGPDCFAFLFEEKERRPFLAEKAEALGIPHGPVRRDLAQGLPVTLPDGRVIAPEVVLGPPQRGARLLFAGDVSHTGPLHKPAEGGRSAGRRGNLFGGGQAACQTARPHHGGGGGAAGAQRQRAPTRAAPRQPTLRHAAGARRGASDLPGDDGGGRPRQFQRAQGQAGDDAQSAPAIAISASRRSRR
jgi:ribonuclease Z